MISTLRPYGATNVPIKFRYEEEGKYYVIDEVSNQYEISKSEYMKLTCPVKKIKRREVKNDI